MWRCSDELYGRLGNSRNHCTGVIVPAKALRKFGGLLAELGGTGGIQSRKGSADAADPHSNLITIELHNPPAPCAGTAIMSGVCVIMCVWGRGGRIPVGPEFGISWGGEGGTHGFGIRISYFPIILEKSAKLLKCDAYTVKDAGNNKK